MTINKNDKMGGNQVSSSIRQSSNPVGMSEGAMAPCAKAAWFREVVLSLLAQLHLVH